MLFAIETMHLRGVPGRGHDDDIMVGVRFVGSGALSCSAHRNVSVVETVGGSEYMLDELDAGLVGYAVDVGARLRIVLSRLQMFQHKRRVDGGEFL